MPRIETQPFGQTPEGQAVELFTVTNDHGVVARLITYGARLTELRVPDRTGKLANVVLGFDNLAQYVAPEPFFGTTVGRVANRIARGRFTLDGKPYALFTNNGPNTLHGGARGFDKRVWHAEPVELEGAAGVSFTYTSPDGEEGFPGTLAAAVTITLSDRDEIRLDYVATTDRPTPVNLTNHSYFNLAGPGTGDVLAHLMMIPAESFTPVDDTLIPTGQIAPVRGTPMDFTTPTPIGARITQVPSPEPIGYDHNYVLRTHAQLAGDPLALAARVEEPTTGRTMEVRTTQPGVQFYSGNFLDGSNTGHGGAYPKHGGFCLETQHFPDSVNQPAFPNTILRPGQTYRQTTIYQFGVK